MNNFEETLKSVMSDKGMSEHNAKDCAMMVTNAIMVASTPGVDTNESTKFFKTPTFRKWVEVGKVTMGVLQQAIGESAFELFGDNFEVAVPFLASCSITMCGLEGIIPEK